MDVHSPTVDVAEGNDPAGQSLDAVFDILSNQRRRYALACLADHTESIALSDLAEDIAVREAGELSTEISKEEVQTISTSLYHIHLPKLVEGGVVNHDQERNLVELSETADEVERVLSIATDGGEGR